jgi:hypothetical protein
VHSRYLNTACNLRSVHDCVSMLPGSKDSPRRNQVASDNGAAATPMQIAAGHASRPAQSPLLLTALHTTSGATLPGSGAPTYNQSGAPGDPPVVLTQAQAVGQSQASQPANGSSNGAVSSTGRNQTNLLSPIVSQAPDVAFTGSSKRSLDAAVAVMIPPPLPGSSKSLQMQDQQGGVLTFSALGTMKTSGGGNSAGGGKREQYIPFRYPELIERIIQERCYCLHGMLRFALLLFLKSALHLRKLP